jgi:peptidylprolyl isomerase
MPVKEGDKVKVQYVGKLEDGTVFDRSVDNTPLEFVAGEGNLIPGFEQGILGMSVGEEKLLKIKAVDAYGAHEESLIKRFPRNTAAEDFEPKKGMVIKLHLRDGGMMPATIVDITDTEIVADLNHPLAGRDLVFEVKVVAIEPAA